jgi:hypothetical protein
MGGVGAEDLSEAKIVLLGSLAPYRTSSPKFENTLCFA